MGVILDQKHIRPIIMQFQHLDHSSILGSSSILQKIIHLMTLTARSLINLCPHTQHLIFINELLENMYD